MVRAMAVVVAVGVGCLAGFLFRLLPGARYWQSVGALIAGWTLGAVALASAWLLAPPPDVDVLAVSFGLGEAVLSLVLMVIVGSILHSFLIGPAAALLPAMERYRAPLMGVVGAVFGAVGFSLGLGGVHPVTQ